MQKMGFMLQMKVEKLLDEKVDVAFAMQTWKKF